MNPLTEIKFKIPFDQVEAAHVEPAVDELLIDANQRVEVQQGIVRQLVSQRIDLSRFKRQNPLPLPPPLKVKLNKAELEDEPAE